HLLFLDSAGGETDLGRYSFVLADPFHWLCSRGSHVELDGVLCAESDPFRELARLLARYPSSHVEGLPPFQGGAAGLWGYDLCHQLERLPRPGWDEFAVPDLALGFYDRVAAFDRVTQRAWLISSGFPEVHPGRRRERAAKRLRDLRSRLRRLERV